MAFIIDPGTGDVISYCEAEDIRSTDQRVFEANEFDISNVPDSPATVDDYIEDLATRATARINEKIRASHQWRQYLGYIGETVPADAIPPFDSNHIQKRKADFTDMCASYTLKEYILPRIADFGNPESSEVQKIKYHDVRFSDIFEELMQILDWYDFDGDGTVTEAESRIRTTRRRRTRGMSSIVRVR